MTPKDREHRINTGSLGGDQIPEDLQQEYADATRYSSRLGDHETVDGMVKRLIERIGKAEATLAQKTREYDKLLADAKHGEEMYIAMRNRCANTEAQVEQLVRQVAEISKPLTQQEWLMNSYQAEGEHIGKLVMDRVDVDDVLASRALTK